METIYLQFALGAFSAVIGGMVSWIGWKIRKIEQAREAAETERIEQERRTKAKLKEDMELLKAGNLALLHNRLVSIMMECQKKGYRRVFQTENVTRMYGAYSGLGGNGTVKQMYEGFNKYPIVGTYDQQKPEEEESGQCDRGDVA